MSSLGAHALSTADRSARLQELQKLLRVGSWDQRPAKAAGATAWERVVGRLGPRRLVDCLTTAGSGGGLIALNLCQQASRQRGELVIVDPSGAFFPPAAVAWGVDAARLLVVTPPTEADAIAVVETSLRSPAVAAVWASLGAIDDRAFRRLLLATEAGGAFGALVRSVKHEPQPSWGDVQLRFSAVPGAGDNAAPFLVRVQQTRNRHGPSGGEALLAIDWRTGQIQELPVEDHAEPSSQDSVRLAAGLAGAARSA